jgi:hypothetical protein
LLVEVKGALEVIRKEDLYIGEIEQLPFMQNVHLFTLALALSLHNSPLPLEVILVIVILQKVFVIILDLRAQSSILGQHRHQSQQVYAFQVYIVPLA